MDELNKRTPAAPMERRRGRLNVELVNQ